MRPRAVVLALLVFSPCLTAQAQPPASAEWQGPFGIEVRVEDHRGRDLEGAEVGLLRLDGARVGPPAGVTGPDGRARLSGLAPGRWELTVRRAGHMSYVAEIVVTADRPQVVTARHENVRGAIAPMRVRLTKVPVTMMATAPRPVPRPPEAVRPANPPVAATPVAAPAPRAELPSAASPASPVTAPAETKPAPAPQPAPSTGTRASAVSPSPASPAEPATPRVAPTPVPAPTPLPAPTPAPAAGPVPVPTPTTPVAPPVPASPGIGAPPAPVVSTPAPERPVRTEPRRPAEAVLRRHADRTCPECPPGESSVSIELPIDGSGASSGCPPAEVARFAALPPDRWDEAARTLPPTCGALLLVLPAGSRYTGYRYEAAADGRYQDCPAGRDCPGLACSWAGDPLIVRDAGGTHLAALFGNGAERPRRARFTAYFREGSR